MSGLDDLRDELVAAAERRVRPHARRRPRVPRGLALLAAVAVLGGSTATALTVVSAPAPDDPYDPVITAGTVTAKAIPMTRADRERMKRERAARAPRTDAGRSFAVLAEPPGEDGLRLAVANATARVFVRATDRETCVRVFAGRRGKGWSGSCSPTVVARERGAFVFTQCGKAGPPQRRVVAGVVPDGVGAVLFVRAGVVQHRAPVTRNGFAATVDEPFDTMVVGATRTPLPPVSC